MTDPRLLECAKAAGCKDAEHCGDYGRWEPENCSACISDARTVILKWLGQAPTAPMFEEVERARLCAVPNTSISTPP